MMSPLALLEEGEIAEIIEPERNEGAHCHFRHRHGHGISCCEKQWGISSRVRIGKGGTERNSSSHLYDMGLRPGKKVEMITNSGTGPLIMRVDECRIAIGRGMAMKIYVRRNGE